MYQLQDQKCRSVELHFRETVFILRARVKYVIFYLLLYPSVFLCNIVSTNYVNKNNEKNGLY